MEHPHMLCIVLAGGEGKRLHPLTLDRAKPAVPFGGNYRLIDFALSNLVNGGYRRIIVLTQYKSHSLNRHIATTWRLSPLLGSYVTPVPAQMRHGPRWFLGSADAIYQNFNLVHDEAPDIICVFGADHIYRMDPRQMVRQHIDSSAGVTVAGIRVPASQAHQFGVIETASDGRRISAFLEKPESARPLPDSPGEVFASMGNYVFSTKALLDAVATDSADDDSDHDVGGNIIPMLVDAGEAEVYDFASNRVPGSTERDRGYWRDVGTIDAYHEAHMDLVSVHPVFNLYNMKWPILSWLEPLPPAKLVFEGGSRPARAVNSMVSPGAVISGGEVSHSVIGPGVRVHADARVENSVLLNGVEVGRDAVVLNAILDKNVQVPDGARIGLDVELDRDRYVVSQGGIVTIGKGQKVL